MKVMSIFPEKLLSRRWWKWIVNFIILLSALFSLIACETEELLRTTGKNLVDGNALTRMADPASLDFFYSTNTRLDSAVTALRKVENEKHFADSFRVEYGAPLWDYTYRLEEEDDIFLFVPLYHADTPCAINAVWLLYISDGCMKYAPLKSDDESLKDNDQSFLFDLLSYMVFGDNNSKGLSFKAHAETRGWLTVTQCWDVYAGTAGHLEYQYSNCVHKSYWVEDALVFCSNNNTDSGGSGNINLGGGGGGGSGTSASSSKADGIFQNDSLKQDSLLWRITENIVDRMIGDCLGGDLYNAIKQKLGDNKINLEFIFNEGASFELDGNTLKLGLGNLESNVLMHELFHAFQAMQESISLFKGAMMNREIEAHYAQYLYLLRNVEWTEEKQDKYSKNQRLRATASLEKSLDGHGNFIGESRDVFDCYLSQSVVSAFRQDGYADYPFTESEDLLSIFSNLKTLTEKCK